MKIPTLFAIALFIWMSCSIGSKEGSIIFGNVEKGSGPIQQKEYNYDFDGIKVSQGIDAEVYKATEEKVVVSAPADIMDKIIVERSGSEVSIHLAPNSRISTERIKVKIFAKDFSSLVATSSAEINVKDKFMLEDLTVHASSSGSVEGNLEANNFNIKTSSSGDFEGKIWAINLNAEATSSGDIDLSGTAKNVTFSASSSGRIDAEHLTAENADLKASSSGGVEVGVSGKLSASASSSGSIEVYKKGNLTVVNKSESSSGSVEIIN